MAERGPVRISAPAFRIGGGASRIGAERSVATALSLSQTLGSRAESSQPKTVAKYGQNMTVLSSSRSETRFSPPTKSDIGTAKMTISGFVERKNPSIKIHEVQPTETSKPDAFTKLFPDSKPICS